MRFRSWHLAGLAALAMCGLATAAHGQTWHPIVVTAGANGAVSPNDTVYVSEGADQFFVLMPDPGYRVRDVKVDSVSVGALPDYTFFGVTGPHTLEVSFSPVPYPVVVMRADSATGTGAYPSPSDTSPWRDLRGGHDGTLADFIFHGSLASGWNGDGSLASPHRLEFTAHEELVTIPAASIPELQTVTPVTASAWFQTNYDGPNPALEYLLEWVEPTQKGMAIAVIGGQLNVYLDLEIHGDFGWAAVAALAPHRWYHVSVAKELDEVRVYLNGERVYTRAGSWLGVQFTPVSIGASCYRISENVVPPYGEFFDGAIAQVEIWRGAFTDAEAFDRFAADSAQYLPNPVAPAPTMAVDLRADLADGAAPYAVPGAGSPWMDLAGSATNATLKNFGGTGASGWNGSGVRGDPHRLTFDGADDVASILATSVTELQAPVAHTAEIWFKTPSDVTSAQTLIEWLESLLRTRGMSIQYQSGFLEVYLDHPGWAPIAPVIPGTWYQVAVAKLPGEVRAYLNGALAYTASTPNMGDQGTEIVFGGSTWRGSGQYGEYLKGEIGRATIWNGAWGDSAAAAAFVATRDRFFDYAIVASADPGGAITPADTVAVTQHANQTFILTPDPGYAVLDVMVDGFSVGAADSFTFADVLANHTISASFVSTTHTIAASAGAHGRIVPPGNIVVAHGANQAFAITPSPGYHVADVLVDGVPMGAATGHTFSNVTQSHAIYARFRLNDAMPPAVAIVAPNGDEQCVVGTTCPIEWSATDAGGITDLDLEYSTDGGGSWLPIASAIANSGAHDWLVPNTPSLNARVRAVVRDTTGNLGADDSDGSFVIVDPTVGVADSRQLGLAGFRRNPVGGDLRLTFSLPDARPADLTLLDLSGRRVRFLEVGSLGPGLHEVDLGRAGRLAAGIYFLRLRHPAGTLVKKAIVTQ